MPALSEDFQARCTGREKNGSQNFGNISADGGCQDFALYLYG